MTSIIDDFAAINRARPSAEPAETPIGALWREYRSLCDRLSELNEMWSARWNEMPEEIRNP